MVYSCSTTIGPVQIAGWIGKGKTVHMPVADVEGDLYRRVRTLLRRAERVASCAPIMPIREVLRQARESAYSDVLVLSSQTELVSQGRSLI